MAQKCVHKGCGKTFTDDNEECVYHPGPPVFHEGQKGWKCCKPRVLTFDEFMTIPPCTTGIHSTVDDTPAPEPKPASDDVKAIPKTSTNDAPPAPQPRLPQAQATPKPPASPAPPDDESDEPDAVVPAGVTCRRRGCNATSTSGGDRAQETCEHHPGQALFHEGSKGWTCCKRRVLEFDDFLKMKGCKSKARHLFVGKPKVGEEALDTVRTDYYQTPATVIASLYLKKIDKTISTVAFSSSTTIDLDLRTTDQKRYKHQMPLFAAIDTQKSSYKIMGTKLEFNLVKADGTSWPVLRADEKPTGEIIQVGRAGTA